MFGFFNNKIFNYGWLPEYEGHEIYYQQMGNPNGEVVLTAQVRESGDLLGRCSRRQVARGKI